jgi:hypothetical protein
MDTPCGGVDMVLAETILMMLSGLITVFVMYELWG